MEYKPGDASGGVGQSDKLEIIDRIYQVAIEPERYEDLLDIWEERLGPSRGVGSAQEGSLRLLMRDVELESHMARAASVLEQLDRHSPDRVLEGLVGSFDLTAAFTISASGRLSALNAAAAAVFGVLPQQPLSNLPMAPEDIEHLKREVGRILDPRASGSSFARFRLTTTGRPIVMRMSPVEHEVGGEAHVLAVTNELAWPDGLSATVREAFGLTEAEVEVLRALVEGAGMTEIAEMRGRSRETVKSQIKAILSKTETHTQVELIRVTLGLMDVVSVTERNASLKTVSGPTRLKERPFRTLRRPGGRRADHIVIGDDEGRPVLYFPLDYGLIRWPASAEVSAERRGLKVIVPIRPGYGHTSPARSREELVDTIVSDTVAVLDHYGVERCPVIALSADSFFVFHLAHAHPGRVSAIINCSTGLPLFNRTQYQRMHKWHRFILANARYAPAMLPFMVKAGFSLARRIGKRGFVHAVYGESPADVRTFENPEVMEAMVLGSEVCLSDWHSAHEAFASEAILQQRDWRPVVDACNVPVHIWQGHQDPQMPMGTVREMQAEFPRFVFHEDPDAGQLIFFKDWPQILDQVESFLD
ncbi:alpha/beta fold hydrolase [Oricola thermophila]|uniref:Alpha/beta fold hydrolase n=1 Tax=Oricola thermophila TaxID=2742145 RepID=A0A6N1VBK8_9HYPH|nr:alpha/beta fold hydrolase [Oricola thermophila]QKV18376.1 alpha/beta fold hydrolase [Oricola thermophila]